ncbi:MAG: SGNH/GDSL hydrolase family protein [Acidimicrobiales bacterium]
MTNRLPPLRRRRRKVNLTRVMARFHEGVATIDATVEPFAQFWDEYNARSLEQQGPLWVALGDSVTQGIGASAPDRSFPFQVLDDLRAKTGQPWRLINLSMSGARFADVERKQLPVLEAFNLAPTAVSAVIGSNDVIWRRNTPAIVDDARRMVDALPPGTVLSRLSEARTDRRRIGANQVFQGAAAIGSVHLYEAWDWPTGDGMWAEDNFHPNDSAHVFLADNLVKAFVARGILTETDQHPG